MSKTNEMTEQEKNEQLWEEERKLSEVLDEKLFKAPVSYEWRLMVPEPVAFKIACVIISLLVGGSLVYMGVSRDELGTIIAGVILCGLFFLMSNYLFGPDKDTHYKLTSLGIICSEKDTIPDVAYTIMRGFAWFSVLVCLAAVVFVGPLAFVGAGGMALLAFKFTGFHAVTKTHTIHFSGDYTVKIFNKGNTLCLFSQPIVIYNYGNIHYEQGKENELIEALAKHIKIIKTIKVKRARDLNPYR